MATNQKLELDRIVDEMVGKLGDGKVTMEDMVDLTLEAMRFMSDMKQLDGPTKKANVIYILQSLVRKTNAGEWDVFDPLLIKLIPKVIDTIVSVEKGKIVINPKAKKCLSKVFCCFK